MLTAFANEIVTSALWTAVSTSNVNRYCTQRLCDFTSSLQGTFPADPIVFPAYRREFSDFSNLVSLTKKAHEFYGLLTCAKSFTIKSCQEAITGKASEVADLRACDLWQGAAEAALLTLYELETHSDIIHDLRDSSRLSTFYDALRLARDGGYPFQEDGVARLPEWAERRVSKRFILNMSGRMTQNRRQSDITALNISILGMGLGLVEMAKPGELASIVLENGRRFVGTIAWHQNNNAGIKFRRPLRPTDPLLSG